MSSLGHYSYVLVSIILVAASTAVAIWYEWGGVGAMITLVVAAALILYWVVARRGIPTPASPPKRIRRARDAGRPLVVYFYSDYDLVCLLARPFTAKAEKTYRGRCEFIFINMSHREAGAAADSVEAVLGQYVLFDARGQRITATRLLRERTLSELLEPVSL
jgi:thiol-disulfide isomerase/thioredoxin